ncbi:hypothetical protein OQH61_08675 [Helicobacter sp. MIT 21-1697]|uniref:hypothetical protein n=1 Tax=Helicobacter sp. MIT 21-1697 TaxID=2993733 RepID=UPI00224A96D8|nr:hypothetical protein [Helicobacter sp. MIT 21-1697]MCX2717804.1 hypothetical protein [Helicobacter sp. MIT 21-1697]
MNIYELQADKALEVQGEFIYVGEEEGKIYVKAASLKKPFILSQLPPSLHNQHIEQIAQARAQKEKEFNEKCATLLKSFESAALGETHIYDMSVEDQLNLLASVLAKSDGFLRARKGAEPKANYAHTKAQLNQVFADSLAHKNAIIYQCGILKSHLLELDCVESINALSWEDYERVRTQIEQNATE